MLVHPEDRYELAIWGWLHSAHENRIRLLFDDFLKLLQKLDGERLDFKTYSWDDLKTGGVVSDDAEVWLVQMLWRCTDWPIGGCYDAWAIPRRIEDLLTVLNHQDLFRRKHLADIHSEALHQAAVERGRRPVLFSEENMSAHQLDELDELLALGNESIVGVSHVHHHGDTYMGNNYTVTNSNSTIGVQGVGDNNHITSNLTVGAPGPLTQEQHKTAISQAQTALVHDQDALERIDDRLYEALGQFLTLARKIQVEQQSLAEVQVQMKATLDEVWAQQEAKGMKPKLLPKTLEVAESLLKSPAMAEVAKKLLGA